MDGGTFDRLTRLLAGRLSRRAGFAAVAAAAAAPTVADARRNGDGKDGGRGPGKRRERGDGRGPGPEGPCGDGSRKDNACTRDGQCCTGLCSMKRAGRSGDGTGRCRCIQRGRPCQEDRNCCGGRRCSDGLCGGKSRPTPTPANCGASGAACANDAACCGGLYCIAGECSKRCGSKGVACAGRGDCCGGLSCVEGRCSADCVTAGGACASRGACCSGLSCVDDACAACENLGGACASDANCCDGLVCAEGACSACAPSVCLTGCAYDNVADAWAAASAGDTIYIGPGTYPTSIIINKSMTLAACPGGTGVVLTPDYSTPGQDDKFSVLADGQTDETAYQITVRGLTLRGRYGTDSKDRLLRSSFRELIDWTLEDVTLRNAYAGIWAPNGTIEISGGEMSNCSYGADFRKKRTDRNVPMHVVLNGVTFAHNDSYGVYLSPFYSSTEPVAEITNCTFRDNIGYGLRLNGDSPASGTPSVKHSVTNCTFTGNQQNSLYLDGGSTTVTGCTFAYNPGNGYGAVYLYDADATLTDCVIEHNSAGDEDGGGILLEAASRTLSTLALEGATVVTNNSATQGGGIALTRDDTSVNYDVQGAGTRVSSNTPNDCYRTTGSTGESVNCGTWQP